MSARRAALVVGLSTLLGACYPGGLLPPENAPRPLCERLQAPLREIAVLLGDASSARQASVEPARFERAATEVTRIGQELAQAPAGSDLSSAAEPLKETLLRASWALRELAAAGRSDDLARAAQAAQRLEAMRPAAVDQAAAVLARCKAAAAASASP